MSTHPGAERRPKLDNRERRILLIVRHLGGRARHGEVWDGLKGKVMSQHTMERVLDDLVDRGFLRRDPPGGGRGWKGEYAYVPPEKRRASVLFYEDIEAIRGIIAKELLPEDAPINRQAEDLAGLLLCLFRMRGWVFASLLQRALEVKTDEGAIHWFMGHAGYLEELTDDTLLLAVLNRRPAAPRALEIFQRCLERIAATPTPPPPSSTLTRTSTASRVEAKSTGGGRDAKKPQKIAEREKAERAAARQKKMSSRSSLRERSLRSV